ncbi:hypothetical protein AXG93_3507s1310 [Marchantia polymorpha subsp. ruderalis]|uniref:Uncharacterized protein n=1 Tax=Marchantia polymorpha subsp. ruderalis TaxID=1480154 RepID=A0A176VEE2_MARPO|nr:hypothetical protein AXG93_3507s1310 [Marchantia polymorpha subsp. ruderalis]
MQKAKPNQTAAKQESPRDEDEGDVEEEEEEETRRRLKDQRANKQQSRRSQVKPSQAKETGEQDEPGELSQVDPGLPGLPDLPGRDLAGRGWGLLQYVGVLRIRVMACEWAEEEEEGEGTRAAKGQAGQDSGPVPLGDDGHDFGARQIHIPLVAHLLLPMLNMPRAQGGEFLYCRRPIQQADPTVGADVHPSASPANNASPSGSGVEESVDSSSAAERAWRAAGWSKAHSRIEARLLVAMSKCMLESSPP